MLPYPRLVRGSDLAKGNAGGFVVFVLYKFNSEHMIRQALLKCSGKSLPSFFLSSYKHEHLGFLSFIFFSNLNLSR